MNGFDLGDFGWIFVDSWYGDFVVLFGMVVLNFVYEFCESVLVIFMN